MLRVAPPEMHCYVATGFMWLRALTLGGKGRPRMLELSVRGANTLQDHLGDPRPQQMYGALHLSAALAPAMMPSTT